MDTHDVSAPGPAKGADDSAELRSRDDEGACRRDCDDEDDVGAGGGGGLETAGGGDMGSCLMTTLPADWPVAVDTGTAGKHSDSMSSILMWGVMESGESGPSSPLDVIEYECSDWMRGDCTASDIMRSCRMIGLSSSVDQSDSELMSAMGDSNESAAHSSLRSESPMS